MNKAKIEEFNKKLRENLLDSKFLKKKISIVTEVGTVLKQARYIYKSGEKKKNYISTLVKASLIK